MSAPRMILIGSISLFALIGVASIFKKGSNDQHETDSAKQIVMSVEEEISLEEQERGARVAELLTPVHDQVADHEVDHIWRLFTKGKKKLPIVETVRYKSRVSWLKGRPAWIADYASYYSTSRHFIARSLNGKVDYYTQKISSGDQFNVLSPDKNINFYFVVDLSRCKMWFYYIDLDSNERFLLKTYRVGLGRLDHQSYSGLLTPKGRFLLGEKISTYKPGTRGYFQDQDVEMVQVFGTRWIPFAEEISGEGDNYKGYGFHGLPWIYDSETETYHETNETLGKYESDGCIRLKQEDIEEIFAIVITKPTVVEIVTDYKDAELPGLEIER